MLFVRKNFIVWRRLLRTLAAFFRLRTMLGFSKKRRRRTSLKMRSPCTTLLNRFNADSNDSLSSTTTRVKKLTPLWSEIAGWVLEVGKWRQYSKFELQTANFKRHEL